MEEALKHMVEHDPGMLIPIILFTIMGVIAVVAIVFGTITSSASVKEQEKTRREIAAYIAEGSMSPEDGERLLAAGSKAKKKGSRCG